MNNLVILNFDDDLAISFGEIAKRNREVGYLIGSNGVCEVSRHAHREIANRQSERGVLYFESGAKESPGWFANALFTLALNRIGVEYLTYVDAICSGVELDRQVAALEKNPTAIAAGRAGITIPESIVTNRYLYETDKRTACLSTPWTMRFKTFMHLSRDIAVFNQISQGINKTFQDVVRFEQLFASIFLATYKTTDKPILLAI